MRSGLFLLLAVAFANSAAVADERLDFFESRIRPVLIEHCYRCHSADAKKVRGGLLLDSKKGTLAGGESGSAVVPGNPADSLLLSALKHESFEMPPDRKLSDKVVRDFEKWIRDGAVDPRSGGAALERSRIDLREGRRFWSFQPVRTPDPPVATGWVRTPIDNYILAECANHGMHPGPDATPFAVLRRLHFGLTGLPPTPADITAFVDAWKLDEDNAVAEAVDKLLASERFGERWGRHWLDVVRYAESSGGGRSLMFPHAWRFRDYVIRSFNADKPFDQLIREHVAGDLLPYSSDQQHDDQITGVGYLTLGPTNYEQQDKELLRMEVVDEQIDTIGRTFLGLTLGCARCHDHKFDPIPTSDYYGLAGIFRSTKTLLPGNVSTYVTTALKSGSDAHALQLWDSRNEELKRTVSSLRKQLGAADSSELKGVSVSELAGITVDDRHAKFEGQWVDSTSVPIYVESGYRHDGQQRAGRRVRFEAMLPETGRYHVRFAYSPAANRCVRVPVVVHHAGDMTTVSIDQRTRPSVDGLFTDLGVYQFDAGRKAVVSVNCEDAGAGVVIVDAVQFLPENKDSTAAASTIAPSEQERKKLTEQLTRVEVELQAHTKKKPKPPLAMAVVDHEQPADWHIHIRGGIRNLGPRVTRRFVSVTRALDEHGEPLPVQISDGSSGRRELADWLASPDNPLTARVFVNRVWMHMLGEGIVRTPDNFGRMGQRPTHPELLDYLAATFVDEDRWSVKKLIRRIAVSRVYRLAAGTNERDADNLMLTRGIRRRLEAEALRDTVLQISGQLRTEAAGGLTIGRLTQYDNGYDHAKHSRGLRSVYVPFFRNSMLEFFTVFDIPNSNLVIGRRTVSTLPSQGLYLLNSPFMLDQAQSAAERFLADESVRSRAESGRVSGEGDDSAAVDGMIHHACLVTLGRPPNADEIQILRQFATRPGVNPKDAWTAVFQALFASLDFRYLD